MANKLTNLYKSARRAIIEGLLPWKDKSNHKQLIIQEVQRVEKTTLIREFGDRNYGETAHGQRIMLLLYFGL